MKKNLLMVIFLVCLLPKGYSQDKIITKNKDTIDCKINKISRNTIFFDVTTKSVKSSGKLPLSGILNYTVSGKADPGEEKTPFQDSFERLRFGINGGPGYLIGSSKKAEDDMVNSGITPGQAKSYYKDMKSGLCANADLAWMITRKYSAGIKYKFFDTSTEMEGFFDPGDGVSLIYSAYKEQIYVNFLGASFIYQQSIGSQNSFKLSASYSLGFTSYRNEAQYLNGYYLLTGKNFGIDGSAGLEYFITPRFSVGTDLSAFFASIRKMKLTDGLSTTTLDLEKENYENLSRVELSVGIRLYIWNK